MRYTLMLLLCLFLLSGCNHATVVSAATSPLPTPYLTLQATAPPILFPSPTPVYTRSLLPTLTPSPTSTPTPGPTSVPVEPFVYCTLQGNFYRCEDRLLQMRFEYPVFMGEIERTALRLGSYAGVLYEYYMGEIYTGPGMGGRSADFSEGRGSMYTDQKGFDTRTAQEFCEAQRAELCQEVREGVLLMGFFPQASWYCSDAMFFTTTPRIIIAVDMPNHPLIKGFGMTDSLFPPNMAAEWEAARRGEHYCTPEGRAEHTQEMEALRQDLPAGTADPEVQARYDAMMRLAESIEGPYVGASD